MIGCIEHHTQNEEVSGSRRSWEPSNFSKLLEFYTILAYDVDTSYLSEYHILYKSYIWD